MPAHKLDELLHQTETHIKTNKDFRFSIGKSIEENLRKKYYENYLLNTVGEGKNGSLYKSAPIYHYNTLLSMAFYKADAFYKIIRKNAKTKSDIVSKQFSLPEKSSSERTLELGTLSALECLTIISQQKNAQLLRKLKQGDRAFLAEYAEKEAICGKALEELRNYHAHIFHEPGPVYFDNFYGDDYKPKKKLSKADWQIARDFFKNRFYEAKEHLLKTVNRAVEENKDNQKATAELARVKDRIEEYEFQKKDIVTYEALLFIACSYLKKSDANYFIKKWTGVKDAKGFSKITQTFFTYQSLKDSKSLQILNTDIFKFRKLIGILSTMPVMNNDCFKPFYHLIQQNNDEYGEKIDAAFSKTDKEKLQSHIIPLRKNQNYTPWLIDYLKDKGLLTDFKIAFFKQPEDREAFLELNNISKDENIVALKEKMKHAKSEEKRKLTQIYKELKKNFLFKDSTVEDDNYCTKRGNAMLLYVNSKTENENADIHITLSPSFLSKWVFAEMALHKGEEVKKKLIKFVKAYYAALLSGNTPAEIEGVAAAKIYPPSLVLKTKQLISVDKANRILSIKQTELQKFVDENNSKRAPWRFASKKKIDVILDYVHLKYTKEALVKYKALPKEEAAAKRRHEALNDFEYLAAFELIRFYGKEYAGEEFKKMFKEDKAVYFKSISRYFENNSCVSLEELFKKVSQDYLAFFAKYTVKEDTLELFSDLFKVKKTSLESNIIPTAKLFAVNQSIPHELISLVDLSKDTDALKDWREKNKTQKDAENRLSDFSLIRFELSKEKPYTNADYLMQVVMPVLLKHKMLPLNNEGHIKGNTVLFNSLMKIKTDELILWSIAKYYWAKANGGKENPQNRNIVLQRNTGDEIAPAFGNANIYNKLYKEKKGIIIQLKGHTDNYSLSIKPTKFDDEFQHQKEQNIISFIENCMNGEERKKQPFDFENLNKIIQNDLAGYLDDVYLLLIIEKFIVQNNMPEIIKNFQVMQENKLPDVYLQFGTTKANEKEKANFLSKLVYKKLQEIADPLPFSIEELIDFRNKSMHQEIQNELLRKTIRKILVKYSIKENLLESKN